MKNISKIIFLLFCFIIILCCSNTEQSELDKGKTAFDNEDYKTAVEHFKKVLKENYKNSEAYLLIGRAYLEMEGDNYNSAIDYIDKSLKFSPHNAEAFIYLGDAYDQRYSDYLSINEIDKLLNSGMISVSEKAIEYYQKAINLNPRYALPYYRLGSKYGFGKNKVDEAIEFYKKGISIDDNYTRVYLHLGELFYKKNEIEQAIFYFKKEISRNPEVLDTYIEIADCFMSQNDFNSVINYLQILAQKDPNYWNLNYKLGIAYQNIDKDKSIEHMKIAARLGDSNAKEWLKKQNLSW